MKRRYTTESGSIYIIDDVSKTWSRKRGPNASAIRTDDGKYTDFNTEGGFIELVCPPINPPYLRYITSTKIVSVEDLDDSS